MSRVLFLLALLLAAACHVPASVAGPQPSPVAICPVEDVGFQGTLCGLQVEFSGARCVVCEHASGCYSERARVYCMDKAQPACWDDRCVSSDPRYGRQRRRAAK